MLAQTFISIYFLDFLCGNQKKTLKFLDFPDDCLKNLQQLYSFFHMNKNHFIYEHQHKCTHQREKFIKILVLMRQKKMKILKKKKTLFIDLRTSFLDL